MTHGFLVGTRCTALATPFWNTPLTVQRKNCDSPQLQRTHVFDLSSRNIEKHNFRYETLLVTKNMKIWKMYLKICAKYWYSIIFTVAAPIPFKHLLLHNFFSRPLSTLRKCAQHRGQASSRKINAIGGMPRVIQSK